MVLGGPKGRGVSWIDFDEEASVFTRGEVGDSVSPITSRIRESLARCRRMTAFGASPRYTPILSIDTTSSTLMAIFSLRLYLLLSLGLEVLKGTHHPKTASRSWARTQVQYQRCEPVSAS